MLFHEEAMNQICIIILNLKLLPHWENEDLTSIFAVIDVHVT